MTTVPDQRDGIEAKEKIDGYLTRSGLSSRAPRVVPLTGDASDRRYFRVLLPDSGSIVLSLHASPFEFEKLPFVNVARLLAAMPVPIPTVLGHADDLGVLALADLGDVTLQAHLGAASAAEHAALYRQAVALIATLQRRGADLASPEYLPYAIAFDVEKLTWELDFFIKHFIEAYRGVVIAAPLKDELRRECAGVIETLAAEPRVLCHRDYHSRNLMLHGDELYIIDFQDARLGPDTYDLVSLVRDSYVDLTESAADELIAYFIALKRPSGTPQAEFLTWEREYRTRFDVMALQRNLKALGTFGYQTSVRRNPVYIQYIPRTIRHVQKNLERHARFARLRELLSEVMSELRSA
jgi:aminoglycoside/choline kinase family phosphotransferase